MTTRQGRTTVRGEERYAAIVEAATARLATHGFEGLRVRDVAADVGLNNATLHYYFPAKEDLIRAVVSRFSRRLADVQPSAQPAGSEPEALRASLRGHLQAVLSQLRATPELFVVMNELMTRANRDPQVAELLRPSQEAWSNHLRALFAASGLAAAKDPRDMHVLAELLMATLVGLSLRLSVAGTLNPGGTLDPDSVAILDLLEELVVGHLRRHADDEPGASKPRFEPGARRRSRRGSG